MENSNSDAVPSSQSRSQSPSISGHSSHTATLSPQVTHSNSRVIRERSRSPRPRTIVSAPELIASTGESSSRLPQEPPYFWKMTSSRPIPAFDPEPRDFEPGRLDITPDFVTEFPRESWSELKTWIGKLKNLHGDYRDRHAELVEMMQELECGMRRLEAKRKDWLKVELDKLSPMPRALRSYIRRINGGDR